MAEKQSGKLMATVDELFQHYNAIHAPTVSDSNSFPAFDTCIGRLENRDLVRRLSFGSYLLLQPEVLDAYASAMIDAARAEPDGLGSIAEEVARSGQFPIPTEVRVIRPSQERLILLAMIEELVVHDLAIREPSNDGMYLVFPTQFNRDWPDAPDPVGRASSIRFEGPTSHVYATLCVRLAHSGVFSTRRQEMWKNAVVFASDSGGKCGVLKRDIEEGAAELILFFDRETQVEARNRFEGFVLSHVEKRAVSGSITYQRSFRCSACDEPVPEVSAKRRRDRGLFSIECANCPATVSLKDREPSGEWLKAEIVEMSRTADDHRASASAAITIQGKRGDERF